MKALHYILYALIAIGAINWGLIGFFEFNLVAAIFGEMTGFTRLIYSIVGLAAIVDIILHAAKIGVYEKGRLDDLCRPYRTSTVT
jgi:uncharacterized protein